MKRLSLLVATILVAFVTQARSTEEADRLLADTKIEALILKLGDADFHVRDSAATEIIKHGEHARKLVELAVAIDKDAEIRLQARKILDSLNESRRRGSGLHVVGLYEPTLSRFRLVHPRGTDTQWRRLCKELVDQSQSASPNPGKRLWAFLSAETRAIMVDAEKVRAMDEYIHSEHPNRDRDPDAAAAADIVNSGLLQALRRDDLYEEKHFADIKLDDEALELLKRRKDLSMLEVHVLNRRLFEASFPGAVKKTAFTLAGATVTVRVAASKTPITLVLCGYESIHWVIKAEKGAIIARVIVGGYRLQGVTGTDAPVDYRVYDRNEKQLVGPRYFYAYEEDVENYPKLVDALRTLTGKEIATFQSRYSYNGGPPFDVSDRKISK